MKIRDVGGTAIMLLQAPIIGVDARVRLRRAEGGRSRSGASARSRSSPRRAARQASRPNVSSAHDSRPPTTPRRSSSSSSPRSGSAPRNAAREIVSERAIYLRERMVNLGLFNYVFSKYMLLGALLHLSVHDAARRSSFFALGFNGGPQAFLHRAGGADRHVDERGARSGSCCRPWSSSAEAAMALTPIALIPQVVLGGLMVPMTTNPMLKPLMYVMPARWGFQGVIAQERLAIAEDPAWVIDLKNPTLNIADDFVENRQVSLRHRSDRERYVQRRVGFRRLRVHLAPLRSLGRHDAAIDRFHAGRAQAPRSGVGLSQARSPSTSAGAETWVFALGTGRRQDPALRRERVLRSERPP